MTKLIVKSPFGGYNIGDPITDPTAVAAIIGSELAVHVLHVTDGTSNQFLSNPALTNAQEGGTIQAMGLFGGLSLSGLNYSIDRATPVPVISPVFGNGTYSFSFPSPSAGVHTLQIFAQDNPSVSTGLMGFVVATVPHIYYPYITRVYIDSNGHTIVVLDSGALLDFGVIPGGIVIPGKLRFDSTSAVFDQTATTSFTFDQT